MSVFLCSKENFATCKRERSVSRIPTSDARRRRAARRRVAKTDSDMPTRRLALLACALLLASPCGAWPKNPFRRKPKEAAKPEAAASDGNASFSATNSTTDLPPSPPSLPPTSQEPPSLMARSATTRRCPPPRRAIPQRRTSTPAGLAPAALSAARRSSSSSSRSTTCAASGRTGHRLLVGVPSSSSSSRFSQVGHPSEGALLAKTRRTGFLLPHGAQARGASRSSSRSRRADLYRLAFSLVFPTPDRLLLTFGFGDADADAYRRRLTRRRRRGLKDDSSARALCTPAASEAPALAPARVLAELRETVGALLGPDGAGDRGGADLFESSLHRRAAIFLGAPTDGSCTRALIVLRLPGSSGCGRTCCRWGAPPFRSSIASGSCGWRRRRRSG